MSRSGRADPLDEPLEQLAAELAPARAGDVADGQTSLEDLESDDGLEDVAFDSGQVAERTPRKRRRQNRETKLTTEIINSLLARPDVHVVKVVGTSAGGPGNLDLDGCIRLPSGIGRAFKIELKVGKERPTPVQTRRLLQWQDAGALVGWATSLVEVLQILERAEDPLYRWVKGGPAGAPAAA